MTTAERISRAKQDIDEAHEAGMSQKESEMWDMIQDYGNRSDYAHAFKAWSAEYIRPKYKITSTHYNGLNMTFYMCPDLKKVEKAYFDFSQKTTTTNQASGAYYTFADNPLLEEVENIGLVAGYGMTNTFSNCKSLKKIARIIVDENSIYNNAFRNCGALEEVAFDGVISKNFDIHWSELLSADSLESIVTHLSDTATGQTITLPTTAEANYYAVYGEGAWAALVATKPNWTFAYA